jgi:two-component system invasion response regulator UvrY
METGSYRILLVDDDPGIRTRVGQLLADELPGAVCVPAANAEEGLALAKSAGWDAIVLDIRLPGRSGLEILGELRTGYPELAIVVMSGLPEVPYAAAAILAGASAYLSKERAPENLPEMIRSLARSRT